MPTLIADDSGIIRSVMRRSLQSLGVEDIHEAKDGREAILMIQNTVYDLIVTDWNMPYNNGLDVIKAAREAGQTCTIVMQTTEGEKRYVMDAIGAGVNDYILKPFNREELTDRLEKHVPIGA